MHSGSRLPVVGYFCMYVNIYLSFKVLGQVDHTMRVFVQF